MVLMIIDRKCVNKPRQNNSKAKHDKKLKISVKLQKTKIYLLMWNLDLENVSLKNLFRLNVWNLKQVNYHYT